MIAVESGEGKPGRRFLAVLLLCLLVGCGGVRPQEEAPVVDPVNPSWSVEEIQRHLRVFNARMAAGRATGTYGFVQVANYVEAQWRDALLQPGLSEGYKALYPAKVHFPRRVRMQLAGRDTLLYVPGVDVLPHARTDSGHVATRGLVLGSTGPVAPGDMVAIPEGEATEEGLRRLHARGPGAVLVVSTLRPSLAEEPLPGLLVVQVAPRVVAGWLGVSEATLLARLRAGGRVRLPGRLEITVETDPVRLVQGLNLFGYVPGKHPQRREELVVVCADLDGVAEIAGVRYMDANATGAGAAALIELARHFSQVAALLDVPERTLLFAVWSGARQGHRGLRAYLEAPLWPLEKTTAFVYLEPPPGASPVLEGLVAPYGIPFYSVKARAGEAPPAIVLDPAWADLLRDGRPEDLPPPFDPGAFQAAAVRRALRMAEEGHRLILREGVGVTPPVPLMVPPPPREGRQDE